jgi:hypothetical protein
MVEHIIMDECPKRELSQPLIDLDDIPGLDWCPFQYQIRYNRETRRLFLWGDVPHRDITSALPNRNHADLDAVIHESPSGLLTIVRGHRLAEWISR